jgi:hypothetical protein
MTETLCTSGAVKIKAGTNSPTLTAGEYTDLINLAEGFFSVNSRYDWVSNYAGLSDRGKKILQDGVSSYAAMFVINKDMSGFTSKEEAQTMLDINWSIVAEIIKLVRDDKFKEFIIKGSVS